MSWNDFQAKVSNGDFTTKLAVPTSPVENPILKKTAGHLRPAEIARLSELQAKNDADQEAFQQAVEARKADQARLDTQRRAEAALALPEADRARMVATANDGLWQGVDQGWWEWVDEKRRAPIPFPLVFNIKDAPKHFQMAHVMVELKLFQSVTEARQKGWNKPLVTGEFWLFNKTKRVMTVWVDESLLDEA